MTAPRPKLVDLFVDNFAQFAEHVDEGVRQSGPTSRPSPHEHAREPLRSPVTIGPQKDPIR